MLLQAPAVPFYGTARSAARDREQILAAVRRAGERDSFILREEVRSFERALAEHVGAPHAIATSSGTMALRLGLQALGLRPGDEVVVPAYGFHSTVTALLHLGARPVLVDVAPDTLTIDLAALRSAIGPRTAGVIPVHMFAAMADMRALGEIARAAGIWVFENSAVAIGSSSGGRRAGLWGALGMYSLHPVKPLGGVSDGAVLVTADEVLATRLRMLRNHGQDGVQRFTHHLVGYNARMDESSAGVLSHRLARLERSLFARAEIAACYDAALSHLRPHIGVPRAGWEDVHGWYAYAISCERRDALEERLAAGGVETKIYYPLALHRQPALTWLDAGSFPVAERASRTTLALPLHPELTEPEWSKVIELIEEFCDGR